MRKLLIIVIEGCSIEYISKEITPNIYRIAKDGFCKCVKAAFPTVDNVNHATILTGKFPCEHKVIGNYYYDKETDTRYLQQEKGFLETETVIDSLHKQGRCTAMLTVKSDVLEHFGKGVDFNMSVEDPKEILVRFLDMPNPPKVESLEASTWILEACYQLLKKKNNDVVYCATNDYMMHHFEPGSKEAIQQMGQIDNWLGKIYDLDHDREIYITGVYGINKKNHLINLQAILNSKGYDVVCQSPYQESKTDNHANQENGVQFIYLKNQSKKKTEKLLKFLEGAEYIDSVCPKEEVAKRYYLPEDRIGDYVAFAAENCAFGEFDGHELNLEELRSHGSLYERAVPLIAVNAREVAEKYRYSRDIVKNIMEPAVL